MTSDLELLLVSRACADRKLFDVMFAFPDKTIAAIVGLSFLTGYAIGIAVTRHRGYSHACRPRRDSCNSRPTAKQLGKRVSFVPEIMNQEDHHEFAAASF